MLAFKKCNACGAVYPPVQADGGSYFHRCPPVPTFFDDTKTPIDRATADGIVKLGGKVYRVDVDPLNLRDENVVPNPANPKAPGVKAAGAGAVDFMPPVDPTAGATIIDGSAKP